MTEGISKFLYEKNIPRNMNFFARMRHLRVPKYIRVKCNLTKEKNWVASFAGELRILWPISRWFFLLRIYFDTALFYYNYAET